ncbi:MAG: cyclic nucleotide-binding domain-containing protein [Chloroflexota bacterium]|nr:cyclic nucleotide-binding domain-containing protein [Chloroflexota bacterium]
MINANWPDADRLAVLRATAELAGWPKRSLRALAPQFDEVVLPAGRLVALEGLPCSEFVIVLEGGLRSRSLSGAARLLRACDSCGWRAMWERGPNAATVVVESEARVLIMGHAQFRAVKGEAA